MTACILLVLLVFNPHEVSASIEIMWLLVLLVFNPVISGRVYSSYHLLVLLVFNRNTALVARQKLLVLLVFNKLAKIYAEVVKTLAS